MEKERQDKKIKETVCFYRIFNREGRWWNKPVGGKYSKLGHLENEYISSLQGWLIHLQSGDRIHMDYVHDNTNEKEIDW